MMDADTYQYFCLSVAGEHDEQIYGALGLAGEAGEVSDLTKKFRFHGHPYDREQFLLELGDVAWYLAYTAAAHDIYLSEVFQANIDKLKARYPKGFSEDASRNRSKTNGES